MYNCCVWKSVIISVPLEQFSCQMHFIHSSPTKAAPSALCWSFSLFKQPALHFAHKIFWSILQTFQNKHRLFSQLRLSIFRDAIRLCLLSNKPYLFSLTKHRSVQSTVALPHMSVDCPEAPHSNKTQQRSLKVFV